MIASGNALASFGLRLWAGFSGTAWLAPLGAAFGTAAAVRSRTEEPAGIAIAVGVGAGLAFWLVAGLVTSLRASAERANSRSYGELVNRLQGIRDRVDRLVAAVGDSPEAQLACSETRRHLDVLEKALGGAGPEWVNGNGYITAWERLHRAEETLLLAERETELMGELLHDQLRLKGSSMPNSDDLMGILRAVRFHFAHPGRQDPCRKPDDPLVANLEQARGAVREVRFDINDFRDQSWNGLLQLRNQTMQSLLLTNIAGYGLLVVAVVAGTNSNFILAGVTFFLVGAAVGLFNHLYQQSQAGAAIEDYGLSTARLLTLPAYSGLAAVGGVLLTVVGTGSATNQVHLDRVFNIASNPESLVVAAVFGIAPGLLATRLGQASQKFQRDIQSTQTGT